MIPKIDVSGLTSVGRAKPSNEDQFLIASLQKSMMVLQTSLAHDDHSRLIGAIQGHVLAVADGLGGHAGGAQASRIAVGTVVRYILNTMPWFFRLDEKIPDDLEQELAAALRSCQRSIETAAGEHPEVRDMGTTLTLAYLLWPRMYIVHAGDSRCYLLRGGELEQITTDHNVGQLVRDGKAGTAPVNRWSRALWNVVGGGTPDLEPEVRRADLQPGDVVLLCTDGLTHQLPEDAIAERLAAKSSAKDIARRLVDAADSVGGKDNTTVVVARFDPEPSAPFPAPDAARATRPSPV